MNFRWVPLNKLQIYCVAGCQDPLWLVLVIIPREILCYALNALEKLSLFIRQKSVDLDFVSLMHYQTHLVIL